MTELKLHSLCVVGLGYSAGSGSIDVQFGETKMSVKFTEAQCQEFASLALGYVQAQQRQIADEIATAQPALLIDASVSNGNFTEVDDDIPF